MLAPSKAIWYLSYLNEALDPLFDVHRIRLESRDELSRDLVDEIVVGHMLPILHNPDNTCLRSTSQILPNTSGEHPTSVWCLRSSSILSCVSFRSSELSTFDETVLILIFCRLEVKLLLNEKESSRFTSLPGGCFFKILYFAQARD